MDPGTGRHSVCLPHLTPPRTDSAHLCSVLLFACFFLSALSAYFIVDFMLPPSGVTLPFSTRLKRWFLSPNPLMHYVPTHWGCFHPPFLISSSLLPQPQSTLPPCPLPHPFLSSPYRAGLDAHTNQCWTWWEAQVSPFFTTTMSSLDHINLASFNCRGFNTPEKRSQILYHFHKAKSQFLLLQ